MLSGSLPPGSSSTPGSGKIGRVRGRSSKRGSKLLRVMGPGPPSSAEHEGGQPPPAGNRQRMGRAQGLEELHQLLARRLVVPGPVPLEYLQQLVDCRFLLAGRIEGHGEIEAGLMV